MTIKRSVHSALAAATVAAAAASVGYAAQPASLFGSGRAAGYWQGSNTASQVPGRRFPTSFVLNQSGNAVTGGFVTASGVYGTGTGTVSGSTATIVWTNTSPQCPGTYRNSYRITGSTMTWTYSGRDCLGDESGSGQATRVPPAPLPRKK
jgi:hypothetical protein